MNALATIARVPATVPQADDFNFDGLQLFSEVPNHPDVGIVALRGNVAVYDAALIHREGILEGCFYVRENQRTPACMPWELWLQTEWDDRSRRASPRSPLRTSREVVRVLRWSKSEDLWRILLPSGFSDGPIRGWCISHDLVGKVIGLYRPNTAAAGGQ